MNEVYVAIYQDPSFDNRIELHNSCFLTIEEGMLLLEDEIIGAWIPAGDGIVLARKSRRLRFLAFQSRGYDG